MRPSFWNWHSVFVLVFFILFISFIDFGASVGFYMASKLCNNEQCNIQNWNQKKKNKEEIPNHANRTEMQFNNIFISKQNREKKIITHKCTNV